MLFHPRTHLHRRPLRIGIGNNGIDDLDPQVGHLAQNAINRIAAGTVFVPRDGSQQNDGAESWRFVNHPFQQPFPNRRTFDVRGKYSGDGSFGRRGRALPFDFNNGLFRFACFFAFRAEDAAAARQSRNAAPAARRLLFWRFIFFVVAESAAEIKIEIGIVVIGSGRGIFLRTRRRRRRKLSRTLKLRDIVVGVLNG